MRRFDEVAATALPAGGGFVVKRQINGVDKVWPVGSTIPSAEFYRMRNHAALLSSHYVAFTDGASSVVQARPLPAPDKPQVNAKVEIVHHSDVIESFRQTYRDAISRFGGDAARARDALLADPATRDLYYRAEKTNQEIVRKRGRLPSLPADYKGLLSP